MATLDQVLAALAAAGITLDAPASAPVQPVAAEYVSPLQRLGVKLATTGDLPGDPILDPVWLNAPKGHAQRDTRETARILRIPLFSCDVDVTVATDAGDQTIAAHGYFRKAVAGEPCRAANSGCKGKVRAK